MFVGAAEHFEEEFGAGLGERDIAELVEDEEAASGQSLEDAFESAIVSGLDDLGDERGDGAEADVFSLGAGGMSEYGADVGLGGAGVSHYQNVLVLLEAFTAHVQFQGKQDMSSLYYPSHKGV